MSRELADPLDPHVPWIRRLHSLDAARATPRTAARDRAVEAAAGRLGDGNSNTPGRCAQQDCSTMLERAVVDPVKGHPDFFQMFPSRELPRSSLAPHIKPRVAFGVITWGSVDTAARRGAQAVVAAAPAD